MLKILFKNQSLLWENYFVAKTTFVRYIYTFLSKMLAMAIWAKNKKDKYVQM